MIGDMEKLFKIYFTTNIKEKVRSELYEANEKITEMVRN